MEKTVNVIERTLEKEKKHFITVCKIGQVCSVLFLALCIVGALAAGFMSVMYMLGIAIDSEIATQIMTEEIYCMINLVLIAVGLSVACSFAVKIFKGLKTGETPFRYDIADKIKGAGVVLIITGLFGSVTELIYRALVGSEVFLGVDEIGIISGCEDTAIFGVVLIALAYIFNYGCKLQQEADETL